MGQSELSFLIELLLNHDLKKETKDAVAGRIREVENRIQLPSQVHVTNTSGYAQTVPVKQQQAPSTLALMAKHGDIPMVQQPEMPPVMPVEQIAQTPAAAAAMNARNAAIRGAMSGKPAEGETSPRKFRGVPK